MRNKLSKLFACIAAILCVTLTLGLFACTSDSGNSGDENKATLTLDKTSCTIEKGDDIVLKATLTGSTETITWSTDAPEVATVDNGTVTAVGAGNAVITAKAGELTATCAVTVTDSQYFPVLTLSKKAVTIVVGNEFPITATVTYRGETVDCAVEWSTSAETVATVENGVITGVAEGTAVITAKAEYNGEKLEASVDVTVNEDSSVTLDASAVTLYTASVDGKDYKTTTTITATIVDNGEAGDAAAIEWSTANAQIATVENGVITAVGEGETQITAKYVTESEKELTATVTVTVVIPVVETTEKIEHDLSTGNIALDVSALLSKNASDVKRVTLNDEPIEFTANGNVITLAATTYGDKTVTVYFADLAYSVKVSAVTKVISTAAELMSLKDYCTVEDLGGNKKSYDGYFVLGNDIDMAGGHFTTIQGLVDRADDYGFIGIFDGRGHVITNVVHSGEQWMFGIVGAKAVIRNVGFVNASLSGRNASLFGIRVHGLVENVFFVGEGHNRTNWTGAFASIAHGTFKNSFVYIKDDGTNAGDVGAFTGPSNAKLNLENCFAVSSFSIIGNDGTNNSVLENSAKAETLLAFKSGDYDLTSFSPEYWQTADGIPCFKAYSKILKGITISGGAAEMYAGDEYVFTSNFEATFSAKTAIENVTVNPNGTVTVSKDYTGSDTLTLVATSVFDSAATAEYNVTLAAVRRVEVEGVYNLELADENVSLSLASVQGDVAKVLDSAANEITFNVSGGNVVFDKASLKAGGYGARKISVVTADTIYDFNIVVISKTITTKTELLNLKTYLDENNKVWDGYILIDADIDMEGANFTAIQPWADGYATGAYGFKGVIDGQGHIIKNLTVSTENQNLTGNLMADGVVKQIGFVNVVMSGNRDLSIIANRSLGHIENIFVVADRTVSDNNRWSGVLVALNHADIYDCVVYVNDNKLTPKNTMGQMVGQAEANFSYYNCFAVGAAKITGLANGKTVKRNNSMGNRATVADLRKYFIDKKGDISVFNTSIWDISTCVPVFKTYLATLDNIQITGAPAEMLPEESVTLKSSHWVTYTVTGDVATISAAGVLTVNATVAADTEITVRAASQFDENKYAEIKVLVKKSLEKVTVDGAYDLETAADGTILYAFDGEVKRVVCDGKEVAFDNIEGGIKLSKEAITAIGTGIKTLRVITANTEYAVTADVWTKIITTKEEFLNLKSYTAESYSGKNATDDGWATSYQLMRYDGRFALGANIDLENVAYPTMVAHGTSGGGVPDYGFRGIFDGRGYTISNLNGFTPAKTTYGIFGVIGADAVIKNVAFVNVTISGTNSGLLAMRCHGTIENVYVQGSRTNGGNFSGAVVGLMHGNMKNVFVNIDDSTAAGGAAVIGKAEVNITLENCYAISQKTALILTVGDGVTVTYTNCGVAASEEALKALEGYDVSGYDSAYWNVESGIPAFKSKN